MSGRATILWRRLDLPGHEAAELAGSADGGWRLAGVAVFAHAGLPCRLEYLVECDRAWHTRRATIAGHVGGDGRELALTRGADGEWRSDGAPVAALAGCVDVDLEFTPSTNLLPIRRLALAIGASAPVRAAWVRFPRLALEPFEQTYTRTGDRRYRFESADGEFRRELEVDASGLVLEYPGFWRAEARGDAAPGG